MTLAEYITENKALIDRYIHKRVPGLTIDSAEREEWIMSAETLYLDALAAGVDLDN